MEMNFTGWQVLAIVISVSVVLSLAASRLLKREVNRLLSRIDGAITKEDLAEYIKTLSFVTKDQLKDSMANCATTENLKVAKLEIENKVMDQMQTTRHHIMTELQGVQTRLEDRIETTSKQIMELIMRQNR